MVIHATQFGSEYQNISEDSVLGILRYSDAESERIYTYVWHKKDASSHGPHIRGDEKEGYHESLFQKLLA